MKSLVTIGTFDGVHRGHQKLLRRLIHRARRLKLKSRVVLFNRPPRFYFQPEQSQGLITLPRERAAILRALGVDAVTIIEFGARWAHMPHTRFFSEFLIKRCRAGGLLVGPDFACGRHRLGNVAWLEYACHERVLFFDIMPFVHLSGVKISSSGIRELLLQGDVARAGKLMGRPYALEGRVIRGAGLGRRIGIPTANLKTDAEKLLPPGVHRVRVTGQGKLKSGKIAVCNIGTRPTVHSSKLRIHVEVHIPQFSGNLYGRHLKLEFLNRIRAEKKFHSLQALQRQIRRDIRLALGQCCPILEI